MARKLDQVRVMRHMARDKGDVLRIAVLRDEAIDEIPPHIQSRFDTWVKWMVYKYGPDVKIYMSHEYDIDFIRYWLIGEAKR